MKSDPVPVFAAAPRASERAEAHVRHIRLQMDKLHAAVAGDAELEAVADRLHAHLAAALATTVRATGLSRLGAFEALSGGTDPGPKPSARKAVAVAAELA